MHTLRFGAFEVQDATELMDRAAAEEVVFDETARAVRVTVFIILEMDTM